MPSHPEPVGLMDNLVSPIATPEPSPNALARRLEGSQLGDAVFSTGLEQPAH